jgi:CMP-N-acetylneuraminic acid synthetase
MKILAIIPAKLDSTRLEKKNLQLVNGKTLVEHSIDYALTSKHDVVVIVSSE